MQRSKQRKLFTTVTNYVCDSRLLSLLRKFFTLAVGIYLSSASFSYGQSASFAPPVHFTVGTNPRHVAVGDFNGDGKPDLAMANFGSNDVSILLGTGSGTFGPATNFDTDQFSTQPRSVAVGDLNGDGKPDLAVANFASPNVSVLLGTGIGAFASATNFLVTTELRSIAIGDFDGDGMLDLAVGTGFCSVTAPARLGPRLASAGRTHLPPEPGT